MPPTYGRAHEWFALPHASPTRKQRPMSFEEPICRKYLEVSEVEADGVHLVARPGLRFRVVEAGESLLSVSDPMFGIHVLSTDTQSLYQSVQLAIAGLWRDYVESDCGGDPLAEGFRTSLCRYFKPY